MPRFGRARSLPSGLLSRTPIQAFGQRGWPGGWQADAPASHVPKDALDDVKNIVWQEGYSIKRRLGYQKITNDVLGQDEANQMHVHYVHVAASVSAQPSFTQEVLYYNDDDGEVFYATMGELLDEEQNGTGADLAYSGQSIGAWDDTLTNYFRTYNIASLVFEDKIYITALRFGGYSGTSTVETHTGTGTDASKPIKYDVLNDTWTRPDPHPLDGSTSGFPSARCAIAAYDRVFVGNIYKQSATAHRYPNRIYFSDAGTAETFQSTSFLTVGSDDGSEITNIVPMGEAIFITKDDSSWLLLGTNDADFTLREVNPRMGSRSSQACIYHEGIVYFFDQSHGLISYDGANFRNISEPINDTMLSSFNHEADFKVNVKAWKNRIFVSIPTGSDITDNVDECYVYDTELGVWTYWDFGIPTELVEYETDHSKTGVGLTGTGDAYFATPDGTSKGVFRLEGVRMVDEASGGDATIDTFIETGWITPIEEIGNRHRIRRLDILTNTSATTGTFGIVLYRDFEDGTTWQSASYDPSTGLEAWHEADQGYDHATDMWVWLRLRIDMDDATSAGNEEVQGYQFTFSSRPWRRGVLGQLNQDQAGGGE